MNISWKWKGHPAPERKEGVATYCFSGGDMEIPMPSFKAAYELAQSISAEMGVAVDAERGRLARSLRNHIDTITR